jgi:hypothetical protein
MTEHELHSIITAAYCNEKAKKKSNEGKMNENSSLHKQESVKNNGEKVSASRALEMFSKIFKN